MSENLTGLYAFVLKKKRKKKKCISELASTDGKISDIGIGFEF